MSNKTFSEEIATLREALRKLGKAIKKEVWPYPIPGEKKYIPPRITGLTDGENVELRDLLVRSGSVSTRNRRRARQAELLEKIQMTAEEAYNNFFGR